jgi:AraC-like DNA-binding protein
MLKLASLDDLPAARRVGAWRDAVCDAFVRLECRPDEQVPLRGRLEFGTLGELHVARVSSTPQTVQRTEQAVAQANDAFVLASVQLRGTTVVSQGGNEAVLTPGCIAFYDTARPYALRLPDAFDQVVLHLPRSQLAARAPHVLGGMARRLPAADPFAQAIVALAPRLMQAAAVGRPDLAERTAAVAQELMVLALESLTLPAAPADALEDAPAPGATAANHAAVSDALVWRTRELIGQQLDDATLSPTKLAAQAHVSLRRLQEVFHDRGTTVSDCIWDLRLDCARQSLANPAHGRDSIGVIAYRAGFQDVAHFSRRFRQRFGMSPSEFRAQRVP